MPSESWGTEMETGVLKNMPNIEYPRNYPMNTNEQEQN